MSKQEAEIKQQNADSITEEVNNSEIFSQTIYFQTVINQLSAVKESCILGIEEGQLVVPSLDLSEYNLGKYIRLDLSNGNPKKVKPIPFSISYLKSSISYLIVEDLLIYGMGSVYGIQRSLTKKLSTELARTTINDHLSRLWKANKLYKIKIEFGGKGRPATFWGIL